MSKSLTDRKFREQSQTPSHRQLEDYLIQVVRQLEKYRVEKLTEKERIFLEKLIKKIKVKLLPPPGLFKLDLQFFDDKKDHQELIRNLEKEKQELQEDLILAAEAGQLFLQKNEELTQEINILKKQIDSLSSKLKKETSNKEIAAQLGLELDQKNKELTSQVNALTEQLKKATVNTKKLDQNAIITDYEKRIKNLQDEKENIREQISQNKSEIQKVQSQNILLEQQIGIAGTENEKLKELNEKLTKKLEQQQDTIKDSNKVLKNNNFKINELTAKAVGAKLVKEGIDKFRELEQQHQELKRDNEELLNHARSLQDRIEELKSENKGLERQIKYNEKKNNRLLKQTENSTSSRKGLSLGEEMKKADELAKTIEKTAELEKQLTAAQDKITQLETRLSSEIGGSERLWNDRQQALEQLEIVNQEISKLGVENLALSRKVAEIERSNAAIKKQGYNEGLAKGRAEAEKISREKKVLEDDLERKTKKNDDLEIKVRSDLEQERADHQKTRQALTTAQKEKAQSELAGADNAKKNKTLQQKIKES
ncbi:10173_t:CDS:2, partial [Gigaspora margarita]